MRWPRDRARTEAGKVGNNLIRIQKESKVGEKHIKVHDETTRGRWGENWWESPKGTREDMEAGDEGGKGGQVEGNDGIWAVEMSYKAAIECTTSHNMRMIHEHHPQIMLLFNANYLSFISLSTGEIGCGFTQRHFKFQIVHWVVPRHTK